MANLFNPEGRVAVFINKIVATVWLNILWFVCCIPVFTIGPSTTALFYSCQKLAMDEGGYSTSNFFHSFKKNFRQGTLISVIMTIIGIAMAVDGYALKHLRQDSVFWTLLTAVFFLAAAAYVMVLMWIFPLLAHFDNTTPAMFKNSLMLSLRFLFCSAFMAAIYYGMAVIIVRFMTPCIIFGMGTCAFLNSLLLKNILIQCEGKTEETEEEFWENPTDNADTDEI